MVHTRVAALGLVVVLLATVAGCSKDRVAEKSTPTTAPSDPLVVNTDLGTVQGIESAVTGVRAFRAMPYAAAPTGDNRWRLPQPRAPYAGTFDATKPGGSCPEHASDLALSIYTIPPVVEDCLTVSVWTPDDAHGLPVLFWIHGGVFREGSAEMPLYTGDDLAANGAVVVAVNFRQGPFGFLATEELAKESADGSVGNYGLGDQRAALRWVQRNIAAFGGDPARVTIFGVSSGGQSVCAHLASKASAGLFVRAIAQSGFTNSVEFEFRPRSGGCDVLTDRDTAFAQGASFLAATGCPNTACLRALPTDTILATDFSPASLVNDGVTLSETAQEVAARGGLDAIPIMMGSNAAEATLFTLGAAEPTDEELLATFARWTDRPQALLALYPKAEYPTNLDRYRTMLNDRIAGRLLTFVEASTGTTFVYQLEYAFPDAVFNVGPTHGADVVPLFAHPEGLKGVEPGLQPPALAALSAAMQRAWVSFAAKGNPGENWEPYATAHRVTVLDDPIRLVGEIRGGRCEAVRALTRNTP